MYTVYMHKFPNGKVYIGITSLSTNARWQYGNGYRNQKLMYKAIKKYGWKNIEHIVLYKDVPAEEAYEKEKQFIHEYNSCNPKYGYNISTGGECGAKGVKISEEHKKIISERQKGRIPSEETRKKLSEAGKGHFVSQETRNKISEKNKGKKMSQETKEKMIASLKEYYKTHKSHLIGVPCSEETKRKISKAKKGKPITEEHRQKIIKNHASKRSVVCLETGKIYSSIKEAALDTGANDDCICGVCNGYRKTAGKLHWNYFENTEQKEIEGE